MTNESEAATGAQVRGAIQQGATGDIRPGFDPAAAPYETDAEAGGQSSPPELAHTLPVGKDKDQKSYDVAMREPGSAKTTSQAGRIAPFAIVVAVLAGTATALCVLSWMRNF